MQDFNWVAVTVAALGSGGIGAAAREFYNMIKLSKEGVSGREDKRRADILGERDYAITRLADERAARLLAERRYDMERENRRRVMETLIETRYQLRKNDPFAVLPEFPDIDDTIPLD